jgi:proteasome assembly chaperone (PAC2) family protein
MYGGGVQSLRCEYWPDRLRAPAFICAFRGWSDAAGAASSAITYVVRALSARRFATIDPEEFYDFQATRPRIKLRGGGGYAITWPEVELFEASMPRAPRDLVMVLGSEPSVRWGTFSSTIVDLAEALGSTLFVTVGALLADIPHTRPISVTGTASDPALGVGLGLGPPSYEGPTGIAGIMHATCQDRGLRSASLWGAVPRYVATTPNPKAALALIRKLEGLVGVAISAPGLESAAADYERQLDRAVQSNPDVQALVERLEQAADDEPPEDEGPLPSGDAIALDLLRFLRQRGGEAPQTPEE